MKNKTLSIFAVIFVFILVTIFVWKLQKDIRHAPLTEESSQAVNLRVVPQGEEQNTIETESTLVEGFPAVPVYKDLELRISKKRISPAHTSGDYYAKWVTNEATVKEMEPWYEKELVKMGWKVEPPNDKEASSEQVIHISKANLSGIVGIEIEDKLVEVVIDLQQNK